MSLPLEYQEDFNRTKYPPWAYENAEYWYRKYHAMQIERDKLSERLILGDITIARQLREERNQNV